MREPRYYSGDSVPTQEAIDLCQYLDEDEDGKSVYRTDRPVVRELARLQRERDAALARVNTLREEWFMLRAEYEVMASERDRLRGLLEDLVEVENDHDNDSLAWTRARVELAGKPVPPTPDPRLEDIEKDLSSACHGFNGGSADEEEVALECVRRAYDTIRELRRPG